MCFVNSDVANLWASAATQEDSKFNRTILSANGLVLGLVLAGKYTRKRYAVVVRAADFGTNEFFWLKEKARHAGLSLCCID
jgi:hypothetical protein